MGWGKRREKRPLEIPVFPGTDRESKKKGLDGNPANPLALLQFCVLILVPETGVEPATYALRMRRSTN